MTYEIKEKNIGMTKGTDIYFHHWIKLKSMAKVMAKENNQIKAKNLVELMEEIENESIIHM